LLLTLGGISGDGPVAKIPKKRKLRRTFAPLSDTLLPGAKRRSFKDDTQ
jgi:hypothetical protein